ncbi:MAG: histidine phosphatase family protein [Bacteroidota bacterium]|nr:histidine phosphatase family protein [Bacteroidota bacterium]MDP4204473.1 histidine phosphatase family protein [Bacteroidota bacterium]
MRRLIIVRHAKAEESEWDKSDYERRLRGKGRKDARLIAQALKKARGVVPNHMISSPAPRAFETAEIFAEELSFPRVSIQKEIELYDGISTQHFLQLIGQTDDSVRTLIVFGHNPSMETVANNLLPSYMGALPTTGTVSILFDVDDWTEINARSGELEFFEYPKLYED